MRSGDLCNTRTRSGFGGFRLTSYDPDFAETMEVAESFLARYKNALRDLAK